MDDRRAILELNRDQREGRNGLSAGGNPTAFGKGTQTWGRHMLRVPIADWRVLVALNPALESKNAAEFTAAWEAFERSDASLPYRVTEDYHGPRNSILFGAGGNNPR